MTVVVTPKTVTLVNGTANDATVVNTMMTDLYTNDATIASYINSNAALTTSGQSFTGTQTFLSKAVFPAGVNLTEAAEPTSGSEGDLWYSDVYSIFEGFQQINTVTGATNATPIVITTAAAHGLKTGRKALIAGVLGNTAANGVFTTTVVSDTTFSLGGSAGNGAYTSGGTVSVVMPIMTASGVNAQTGTTYTVLASDRGRLVTFNNASAVAVTLPQAGTTGFAQNYKTEFLNLGAGAVTVTPTTSTVNGAATLVLAQGQGALISADDANYFADQGKVATPIFSVSYTSSGQTITAAGTLTLAHGLGAAPKQIRVTLVCTSADQNYSVNDVVDTSMLTVNAAGSFGLSFTSDATNLVLRYAATANVFYIVNKTTGNVAAIDQTKWQVVMRAFA